MKNLILIFTIFCAVLNSCEDDITNFNNESNTIGYNSTDTFSTIKSQAINYSLVFPVEGNTYLKDYYNANPYGNITKYGKHLGVDLTKPGNDDYRDTIYSIGYGVVKESIDALITIVHKVRIDTVFYIVSSYFHCDTLFVTPGEYVTKKQPIGLIGKKYTKEAHLHFEILLDTTKACGFYWEHEGNETSCIDPVKFINFYNNNWNSKRKKAR
jgi:murein DD-endopeptidase MepM/ murein hydrolase activator NlpD